MEHRGAEGTRGCRSREFRVSQVYPLRQRWGTMRAVPFSALPFFIKPWKYYTAYPCHSSRLFVSTINTAASLVFLFHTPSPRRSTVDPPTYHLFSFVFFFYPVIIIKTIFFREVPEVFTVYFHREWDIFIGKTARHPRYCSALIYFFPFFRPRIFSEIWEFRRNEYVISRYRLHGFYIMRGKRPG